MTTIEDRRTIADDRQMTMEAILSRDQRTTAHRVLDHRRDPTSNTVVQITPAATMKTSMRWCRGLTANEHRDRVIGPGINKNDHAQRHSDSDSYYVPAFYDDRRIRSRHNASIAATTWLRLGSLLVTLLVVSVQSAPTMTPENRRLSSPPKWVNPCGLATGDFTGDFTGDMEVDQLTDSTLLEQVFVQAKIALQQTEFRGNYVKRIFNMDFEDWRPSFADYHYDWLPGPREIPKQLGEQLNQEYLDSLELDTALINAYEYMQRYAVGLEQMVWDQEDLQLDFLEQFKSTENHLRSVLCELQVALVERQLTSRPDVTRDIMDAKSRQSSSDTDRNLRDWLIFRDYMNCLEYVVQVFEHLHGRIRGLQS
ncbi:uncharacterized protein LOC143362633 [Halictus rubicundus]|uniref:uncharacterized protein LOC143362633 n=1 Tax=Halictus rubicundus TaxID=77578 RepID=UPI00403549F3